MLFENPLARIYSAGGKAVCEFRGGTFSDYKTMPLDFGTPLKCKFFEIEELGCKGVEQCKSACLEKNGKFENDGNSYHCGLPVADAGKTCSDDSECISKYCVPEKEFMVDSKLSRKPVGQCYGFTPSRAWNLCGAGIRGGVAIDSPSGQDCVVD